MPFVKILVDVCLGGGVDAAAGDVRDVPRSLAVDLVECGQAEYCTAPEPITEVSFIDRDPEPTNRDPKPKKGKSK